MRIQPEAERASEGCGWEPGPPGPGGFSGLPGHLFSLLCTQLPRRHPQSVTDVQAVGGLFKPAQLPNL